MSSLAVLVFVCVVCPQSIISADRAGMGGRLPWWAIVGTIRIALGARVEDVSFEGDDVSVLEEGLSGNPTHLGVVQTVDWTSAASAVRNKPIGKLWRGGCDDLSCILKAKVFSGGPTRCYEDTAIMTDWDVYHRWSSCKDGFFLAGFKTSSACTKLNCLSQMKCCKLVNAPSWENCYIDKSVANSWSASNRWAGCQQANHAIVAMKKGSCDDLHCIEMVKCCGAKGEAADTLFTQQAHWLPLKMSSASQISTGWGGVASRAVDGNPSGSYADNSCTHTQKSDQAWWQLFLGQKSKVSSVQVTNRERFGERLNPFRVMIDGQTCASDVVIPSGVTLDIPCHATGKVLKIGLEKDNFLVICEVKVRAQAMPELVHFGDSKTRENHFGTSAVESSGNLGYGPVVASVGRGGSGSVNLNGNAGVSRSGSGIGGWGGSGVRRTGNVSVGNRGVGLTGGRRSGMPAPPIGGIGRNVRSTGSFGASGSTGGRVTNLGNRGAPGTNIRGASIGRGGVPFTRNNNVGLPNAGTVRPFVGINARNGGAGNRLVGNAVGLPGGVVGQRGFGRNTSVPVSRRNIGSFGAPSVGGGRPLGGGGGRVSRMPIVAARPGGGFNYFMSEDRTSSTAAVAGRRFGGTNGGVVRGGAGVAGGAVGGRALGGRAVGGRAVGGRAVGGRAVGGGVVGGGAARPIAPAGGGRNGVGRGAPAVGNSMPPRVSRIAAIQDESSTMNTVNETDESGTMNTVNQTDWESDQIMDQPGLNNSAESEVLTDSEADESMFQAGLIDSSGSEVLTDSETDETMFQAGLVDSSEQEVRTDSEPDHSMFQTALIDSSESKKLTDPINEWQEDPITGEKEGPIMFNQEADFGVSLQEKAHTESQPDDDEDDEDEEAALSEHKSRKHRGSSKVKGETTTRDKARSKHERKGSSKENERTREKEKEKKETRKERKSERSSLKEKDTAKERKTSKREKKRRKEDKDDETSERKKSLGERKNHNEKSRRGASEEKKRRKEDKDDERSEKKKSLGERKNHNEKSRRGTREDKKSSKEDKEKGADGKKGTKTTKGKSEKSGSAFASSSRGKLAHGTKATDRKSDKNGPAFASSSRGKLAHGSRKHHSHHDGDDED